MSQLTKRPNSTLFSIQSSWHHIHARLHCRLRPESIQNRISIARRPLSWKRTHPTMTSRLTSRRFVPRVHATNTPKKGLQQINLSVAFPRSNMTTTVQRLSVRYYITYHKTSTYRVQYHIRIIINKLNLIIY